MKSLKIYFAILMMIAITSCEIKTSSNTQYQVSASPQKTSSVSVKTGIPFNEIVGVWIKRNENSDVDSLFVNDIIELNIKSDSTVVVKLSDESGEKKVAGTLAGNSDNYKKAIDANVKKALGDGFVSGSGITLKYSRNGMGMNIITLMPINTDKGIVLKCGREFFERKE